jgi:hypothetical protein
MIEKLESGTRIDRYGNTIGESLPSTHQIIDRINELIDVANRTFVVPKDFVTLENQFPYRIRILKSDGSEIAERHISFRETIARYVELCKQVGDDKPYSGVWLEHIQTTTIDCCIGLEEEKRFGEIVDDLIKHLK